MAEFNFDYLNMANPSMPQASGLNLDYLSPNYGTYQPQLSTPMPSSYPMNGGGSAAPVPLTMWDSFKQGLGEINWLDKAEGGQVQQGALGGLIGGASALMNGYLGMKQYGLAKDTLKFNKEQFYKNFDAQKRTTNASLADRQAARVASNPGAYESVGSYMDKNGIR